MSVAKRPGLPRSAWTGVGLVAAVAIGIAVVGPGGRSTGGVDAASIVSSPALPPLDLFLGRSFFEDPWIAAPASTTLREEESFSVSMTPAPCAPSLSLITCGGDPSIDSRSAVSSGLSPNTVAGMSMPSAASSCSAPAPPLPV